MRIPFNKPYLTGKEVHFMYDAVSTGKLSGNGKYTQKCQAWFEDLYGFGKCLLTSSCTDALEMSAILADIQQGDEVIIPSYTFVSTANAFVLRGAKIVFADSASNEPGIDTKSLEALIGPKTKVIVPVHYAGVACDMEAIMNIANKHNLLVIEDAAQAIDSFFTFSNGERKALGSIGHMAAFSFHETKNLISGEGGMLVVNDDRFKDRAEIIWEKGTNRSAFFRGEVDKYGWVDVGSSFLPSDVTAAFLYAQLEHLDDIQNRRKRIWNLYHNSFQELAEQNLLSLPYIPEYATNNAHMYYIICKNSEDRAGLIDHLKEKGFQAVFHYLSLHKSPYMLKKQGATAGELIQSDRYSQTLVRLPFFYELKENDQLNIIEAIKSYFKK